MRDIVTKKRCLSLAGSKPRITLGLGRKKYDSDEQELRWHSINITYRQPAKPSYSSVRHSILHDVTIKNNDTCRTPLMWHCWGEEGNRNSQNYNRKAEIYEVKTNPIYHLTYIYQHQCALLMSSYTQPCCALHDHGKTYMFSNETLHHTLMVSGLCTTDAMWITVIHEHIKWFILIGCWCDLMMNSCNLHNAELSTLYCCHLCLE